MCLTLGVGAIPVFANLTCYYYGILLAFAFLWPQRRIVGVALAWLAVVTCATPALLSGDDDRYTLISVAILAFVTMTTVVYASAGPIEAGRMSDLTGGPAHVRRTV